MTALSLLALFLEMAIRKRGQQLEAQSNDFRVGLGYLCQRLVEWKELIKPT
jgi:hypothetical protein